MLAWLKRPLYRNDDYLPLPTSSPRGSVSASPVSHSSEKQTHPTVFRHSARWLRLHLSPLKVILGILFAYFSTRLLFSSSPSSLTSVYLISDDSTHRIFDKPSEAVASRDVLPIRAYEAFTDECVEEWIVHHTWGTKCQGTDLSAGLKINGVWAWVNGSDPAQVAARNAYRPSKPINVDAAHRYADHNELKYSMRSAYASFGPQAMSQMHIMASAYPLKDEKVSGQVPSWLADKNSSNIVLHHDAEYFKPMPRADGTHGDQWLANTVPSFNSLAVESQLFNLASNDADQLVYFNDDFFTLSRNTVADVTSPLFGPVLKTDTRPISFYWPSEHPFQRLWNPAGEEVGIKRAGWILGRRFSMRTLPYITHHPRSLSLPLLKEAAQTFPDAFSDTALARFRAQKEVPTSIQAFFLASWYIVERHREALLWTWAVAKWGGDNGIISAKDKDDMWTEIAGSSKKDVLQVRSPQRASPDDTAAFKASGTEPPQNTQYSFSSKDGHGLSYLDWTWPWQRSRNGYPDLSGTDSAAKCSIAKQACFKSDQQESANSFFQRVAFEKAECGDCLIAALMAASGPQGIEKFMPSAEATVSVPVSFDNIGSRAHLPLTDTWKATDFSLSAIFPASDSAAHQISLRSWTARLIQRYQYVLGSTPSTFYKVEKASRLPGQLATVDVTLNTSTPTTYLCLNDDIKENEQGTKKINTILKQWFESHWPNKLPDEN